eukprot:6210531-Pleurochrysis_carterae.AAC.3
MPGSSGSMSGAASASDATALFAEGPRAPCCAAGGALSTAASRRRRRSRPESATSTPFSRAMARRRSVRRASRAAAAAETARAWLATALTRAPIRQRACIACARARGGAEARAFGTCACSAVALPVGALASVPVGALASVHSAVAKCTVLEPPTPPMRSRLRLVAVWARTLVCVQSAARTRF